MLWWSLIILSAWDDQQTKEQVSDKLLNSYKWQFSGTYGTAIAGHAQGKSKGTTPTQVGALAKIQVPPPQIL